MSVCLLHVVVGLTHRKESLLQTLLTFAMCVFARCEHHFRMKSVVFSYANFVKLSKLSCLHGLHLLTLQQLEVQLLPALASLGLATSSMTKLPSMSSLMVRYCAGVYDS